MNTRYPSSHSAVASHICASWQGETGNYVVVAPPLTYPEYVFKLLRNISFQETSGLNPDKLAIAYIPPSCYSSSNTFVQRVLKMWRIEEEVSIYDNDDLGRLECALETLDKKKQTPIILLPQFHKTVDKLSWTLGARLRELEVNYGLSTVVELPVPLSRLRERWELLSEKDSFICSDFGQGHGSLVLTGYKEQELELLARESNLSDEIFKLIQQWSGGLPGLARWLMQEAQRVKTPQELEAIARKGSLEQTKRFLKWLDAPGAEYFKRSISAIWHGVANSEQLAAVREHDWKEVLIDRKGNVKSESLALSCVTSIYGSCENLITMIASAVEKRLPDNVEPLVRSLSDACRVKGNTKAILALVQAWQSAIGLSPDWDRVRSATVSAESQTRNITDNYSKKVSSALAAWRDLAKDISSMVRYCEKYPEWRLTDCLSGRGQWSPLPSVQLVIYRLYSAEGIKDYNAALKSVLEIPEQILQIYCGRKLNISVWCIDEFDENDINRVRMLWKKGDFRKPSKSTRLGFSHLLFFGWVGMEKLDEHERLFSSFEEVDYWRNAYEEMRNAPSHSITFVSKEKWDEFYLKCMNLAEKLALALTGRSSNELLPRLDEIIVELSKPV